MNSQQIKELSDILQQAASEITELLDVSLNAAETVTLDQSKVGRVSRIDAIQQQEMAKANVEGYQKRLSLIKIALKKIRNEDYGYCEACDEVISFNRLKIKPESKLCIACQEQAENS